MKIRLIVIILGICLLMTGSTPAWAQVSVKESEQLDFAQSLLARGMYDMAILQYRKFISEFPQSPSVQEAYLALGEGYFLSQEFDEAVNIFNQFIHRYPNSDQLPVSVLRLGQIEIQQNKYDEALKELTSVDVQKVLKGPMLQSFDFYTGEAYLGKADTASALNYFNMAIKVEGASEYTAFAYKEIGQIQAQSGNLNDALDAYAKALQTAEDNSLKAEIFYRTAEAQYLSGKFDDAIKGFGQVLEKFPGSEFTQGALANILLAYYNLGQYDQLLNEYQKDASLVKEDETYFDVHLAAAMANIELKKYDQANALLDKMLAFAGLKSSEMAKVFINKADILIREKKYKDSLALLDAYSSENTDIADETYFLKAQALYGLGEYDKAFDLFENVSLHFPDSRYFKAALLGEAHSRQKTGKFKEAQDLFLKYVAIQEAPDLKSEALYDAIMMAVKEENASAIITSAQDYLKAFPNAEQYSDVLLLLAEYYGKNNQPKDAMNLLQGYLAGPQGAQRPNSANFLLGFNQELSGNSDGALASYAKIDPQKEGGKFYVEALKNMAIIYLSQNNLDQAKVYFDKLVSQAGPHDLQVKTYVWICNEYLKEQKYDDVLRVALLAEKNFPPPDLQEIEYFEAEALRGLGRCDEADQKYGLVTASVQKNAFTGSAHIGYGLCLEKVQKFDAALREFQSSLAENADDSLVTAHAQFEIANLDAAQGNTDEALKFYVLVATIYDDAYYCSESLLRSGQIFERLKRKEDALKMYAEVLDKYKDSKEAVEAAERVRLLK